MWSTVLPADLLVFTNWPNLTTIGEGAFQYFGQRSKTLKRIQFDSTCPNLKTIGDKAFQYVVSDPNITATQFLYIANYALNLESIGNYAFSNVGRYATNMTHINITKNTNLKTIGNYAFDSVGYESTAF